MLNSKNERELAYLITVDAIEPIPGKDRVECAVVGGWRTMVKKGVFKPGSIGIYIEIDSKTPEKEPFGFLEKYHYKVKTQKFKTFYSQCLLMAPEDFGWNVAGELVKDDKGEIHFVKDDSRFLTSQLGITYATADDNKRKAPSADKYKKMAQRHPELFKKKWARWMMKRTWGKKVMFFFFGKKKDKKADKTKFPTHFPYISKTDQERCENIKWVLEDKTPYIVTQKCDGSSGTFILERKRKNFEFYVCSRNVRQLNEDQECYYEENYYWEAAKKYDIETKMKDFLEKHPDLEYVCWQGEICSPKIQKNPHGLTELHLFCFHMIDSKIGKYDIREAAKIWKEYNMEIVPIIDENYILPDDFEEFKLSADGFYNPECCEGKTKQPREGYVYYKTTDPNFSFKNVSRTYLLKHE